MEIRKLGSIYFTGDAQIPGFNCGGFEDISFSDTVPGREIQWVRLKSGLLVADKCVCTNISWDQLNHMGFVFGTPVRIDGEYYLCRCLKVGADESETNEWDDALDEVGEDDTLWHWNDEYFWGQETSKYGASLRAVRGYHSARGRSSNGAAGRNAPVGFRPVLEPLGSESCLPDTLVGKKVKVYGSSWVSVEGMLAGFDNYDLVLKSNSSLPTNYNWAITDGNKIIVRRDCICWLKEA